MMKLLAPLAATAALAVPSCGPVSQPWEVQRSERAAHDRIMLVRHSPETLGHRRLSFQSAAHPDLRDFLTSSGMPDFIAETSTDDRQYLILYYVESGRAFAARTRRKAGTAIEFAGPYKMTAHEKELLSGLKRESGPSPQPMPHVLD